MHLLVIMRLGSAKARDKLAPLLDCPAVTRVTLVRHAPVPLESPKLVQAIHHVGLNADGLGGGLAALRNLWACAWNGLRLARRERPDVVLSFNLVPYGLIAWAVGRLAGRRVVLSLIGTDYNRWVKAPVWGTPLRAVLRDADAVAVFGDDARRELVGSGLRPERVFVLPNTVDTTRFYPDPDVTPDYDLIGVGHLTANKRVDTALRALAILRETRPGARLLVVGDGPQRAALAALADELGVAAAVTFAGQADDVPQRLRQARLLLLLSEREGLPLAVLEALATGLPVIVTAVGALPTVVRDGENGCLLPSPADPAQVAARALELLQDPQRYARMSQAALGIRQTHGYAHMARAWEALLAALAG